MIVVGVDSVMDVPSELTDRVRRTSDELELCLHDPVRSETSPTLLTALATTYVCTATAAALLGPITLLSHTMLSLAGLGFAHRSRVVSAPVLRASRAGWAIGEGAPQRAKWVQLVGDPYEDDEVRLLIDKQQVRAFPIDVELGCWTYANLDWLARALADALQVPFRDHRDPIRWRSWEHDQRRRVRHVLDRHHARSSLELPRELWETAWEPQDLTLDLDSMAFTVPSTRRRGRKMRISRSEVTIDSRTYPISAVIGVAVVARRVRGEWTAQLQLGLYDAIYAIGTAHTPREVRMLRGVASYLEQARSRGRRLDTGGFADIPDLLHDVRKQALGTPNTRGR